MSKGLLADVGELELIRRLAGRLGPARGVVTGIGDDAAVVRPTPDSAFDLVLTSDAVIQGTHFLPDSDPRSVGHKVAGRALSDLAAMGAEPDWALIDLSAPPDTPAAFVEAVYDGAAGLAARHGLAIVGGDTARSSDLALHIFAVGRVPAGRALLRSGAGTGDAVYVTGSLGCSIAGRHLSFEPRVREGIWLRESGIVTSAIDVSDGLARDMMHILEMSGVGAVIEQDFFPVSPAAAQAADGLSPVEHALHDGEDFELLFTLPAEEADAFDARWHAMFSLPCTRIGRITANKGNLILSGKGGSTPVPGCSHFDHFRRGDRP